MFFSVIIPVYGVEKYLPDCVESVLNQTFSDFEIILVDDGSKDRCPEICDEYKKKDGRIKVLHKENGGLASARRAGIKIAEGEYVFNLDSDDKIEPDTLETAYNIINEYFCDIVSFSYKWVESGVAINITEDAIEEGFYDKAGIEEHIFPEVLMSENMKHMSYYLSGKAVRREFLTPIQLSVSEKISLGEDLCCVVPCYMKAESVYISKKAAYLYTVRSDSLSKEFNTSQIFKIEDVINELVCGNYEKPSDFSNQLDRYSAFMCFAILAQAAEGNHFESIEKIADSIKNSIHNEKIRKAGFKNITVKSKISIFLMKKNLYKTAFYFLNFIKKLKNLKKRMNG